MIADDRIFSGGGRAMRNSLYAAAIGGIALCVAFLVDARMAAHAYLIAYCFAVSVAIGAAAFVMAAHAMNAQWPVVLRRVCESCAATLPLLALLSIPLLASIGLLYPWMHPEQVTDPRAHALLVHKLPYMNAPLFCVRTVIYVGLWALIAILLRRWSLQMDRPGAPDLRPRLRAFSSALLPPLGITGTFAAFDWLMSLSPVFYSTAFGLYLLAGGFVAFIGLLAVLLRIAQHHGFLVAANRSHWYAIGRLLFAFLVFWAYIAFFQLLIIWLGNKPIEITFYLQRMHGIDRALSGFLVVGHFAVPWLILLSYWVKRDPSSLTLLGAWTLLSHYLDVHWLVGAARAPQCSFHWSDAAALLFVAGACVAFAIRAQRGRLIAAVHDPSWAAGAAYESR
jgi:hypothetical protein